MRLNLTVQFYRKTRLGWQDNPWSEVGVENSLPDPEGGGQGIFWHPTEDRGLSLSTSLSFAFIIPLNYQIKAKNTLYLRREEGGPDQAILPLLTFKPEAPEPRRFSPIFALLLRK